MRLIPAIDLRAGRCVRLLQGDFGAETAYPAAPARLLLRYQSCGARWVHLVDLDGARAGVRVNRALIAALATVRDVRLQVGGGVRDTFALEELLNAAVARVVIGSAAVERPAEVATWLARYGPERLCLAFDVRVDGHGVARVQTRGWSQDSGVTLWQALGRYPTGLRHVLCTDIGRDGALSGPNLDLYRAACARFPHLSWQASGGVRDAADLAALAATQVAATVCGKALLEERISCEELRPFLPDASSPASTSATAGS